MSSLFAYLKVPSLNTEFSLVVIFSAANLDFTSDDTILDEYLPWSEKVQLECRMKNVKKEVKEKDDQRDETA